LFSILLHAVALLIFSLIMFQPLRDWAGIDILGGFNIPGIEPEAVTLPIDKPTEKPVEQAVRQMVDQTVDQIVEQPAEPSAEKPAEEQFNSPSIFPASLSPLGGGFVSGGNFTSRNAAGRGRAVGNGDCSVQGESAVEAALEWLAAHQQADGGWSFDFDDSCQICTHGGTGKVSRRTAATAIALLPFLGAGYTHQVASSYQKTVEKGLLFLAEGKDDFNLAQDTLRMYSYGLAAITLCEAYSMSNPQNPESKLGQASQQALLLIETAQDVEGGGWRYRPNQSPGDLSVFAWQVMALKSGKLGGLNVSQSVLYAANDFLGSVAVEGGRRYNYLPSGEWDVSRGADSPKTCTAIGLLMRMYLGWKPGDKMLDEGIDELFVREVDPPSGNLYYTYYATLALHHYGGKHWNRWNAGHRRFLIRSQSHTGHESGSWYFPDQFCDSGGRLLNTALGAMILETPYRVMPLYRTTTP
jgi:hypothetical protein